MRRLLTALVLLLAAYFVWSQFAEFQQVAATLRRGNLGWLGLAVAVQLGWLLVVALAYRSLYRLLGMSTGLDRLVPLAATSYFVNVAAPSGGLGGMAVFIADARRQGYSSARVAIAGMLFLLFDYLSFLCVLALGLVVLIRRNNLTAGEAGASALLLLAALGLAALLALGARSAQSLERVLVWAAHGVNRLLMPLLRRPYLSEARAHHFAAEMAEGLRALRGGRRDYVAPAAFALLGKALLIGVLGLIFLAFKQPFSAGTLIAGFSIGFLFMIVSPTPSGIGLVEGAMILSLRSLRVPLEAATVITLAYRGLTFWLPLAYGFVALRLVQRAWRQAPAPEAVP